MARRPALRGWPAPPPCPRSELHTVGQPESYLGWHAWAEEMGRTHVQERCPGCGRWAIWKPKPEQDDDQPREEAR
jgi:hypothetical protein